MLSWEALILHILPTLVDLQGNDHLHRSADDGPVGRPEDEGPYLAISTRSGSHDVSSSPHVPWMPIFLQEDNVSNSTLCCSSIRVPDLVKASQAEELFFRPPSQEVVLEFVPKSHFLPEIGADGWLWSRW